MIGGMEIAVLVGAAVLLFGADKVPKLARSMGQVKKEYMVGQAEADVEAERLRTEARASAEARTAEVRNGAPVADTMTTIEPSAPIPPSPEIAPSPPQSTSTH